MQLTLLPLVFFTTTVLSFPVQSGADTTFEIAKDHYVRSDETSPIIHRADDQYVEEDYEPDYEDNLGYSPSDFETDEDPTFAHIFNHIEEVLGSAASTKEQLGRILDAIIHYAEVSSILQDKNTNDEKTASDLDEGTSHEEHAFTVKHPVDGDQAEAVLERIGWTLYEDQSLQKRVQMMLNAFADYLHPQHPKAFSEPQELLLFEDARFATDIEDDVEDDSDSSGDGENIEAVWR